MTLLEIHGTYKVLKKEVARESLGADLELQDFYEKYFHRLLAVAEAAKENQEATSQFGVKERILEDALEELEKE